MLAVAITTLRRLNSSAGLWFAVWLAIFAGNGQAEEAKRLDSERAARLIRELDHESYAVRNRATQEFAEAGPAALTPLVQALNSGSLERRLRVVDLISRIYGAGDEASFDQAERALDAVAETQSGSLKAHAVSALRANAELRERFAVAALRRLGGSVVYQSPNRGQNFGDAEGETGKGQVVAFVVLTHGWSGGDEGLWHLRRLPQLRLLYRVKTAKVSDEAIQKVSDDLALQVEVRGAAYLGIQKRENIGGIQGCQVGDVKPGAAAAKAGIQENDIITQFDNRPVTDFQSLTDLIGEKQPGDVVPITVERNGETVELKAELTGW